MQIAEDPSKYSSLQELDISDQMVKKPPVYEISSLMYILLKFY